MSEKKKNINLIFRNGSGIVYEAINKFGCSIHRDVYVKAHDITERIICQNQELRRLKADQIHSFDYSTQIRNLEQISNVLFFTGERGSGKTSTMLSYMEFLKDYYRNTESGQFNAELEKFQFSEKNLMFTGLEYIDASRLAPKETILGVVLAKMVKKWLDEENKNYPNSGIQKSPDYEYKKRQLRFQFSDVYKRLSELVSKTDILDPEDDMYLDTLKKLSFTVNLKASFEKLVQQYVDIMQYPGVRTTTHYLVIPIDDVDMNIQKGYDWLEDIRNYLMIPNIIVMVSANYDQLQKVCYNHYKREFANAVNEDEYIAKLTREYLEKIVPGQNIINLNSGFTWDAYNNDKIKFGYEHNNLQGETMEQVIKNLFLTRFGIHFFEKSKCLRYFMPETLREASSWVNNIVSLDCVDKQMSLQQYQKNMKFFWNEIFEKIVQKHLGGRQKKQIHELMELGVYEQKVWLQDYYNLSVSRRDLYVRDSYVRDSIAELFWKIHNLYARDDKNFYNILLLYFTSRLSEFVTCIKLSRKGSAEKNYYVKELRKYYQGGLFGKSELELVPEMMRDSNFFGGDIKGKKADISSAEYGTLAYFSLDKKDVDIDPSFFRKEKMNNEESEGRKIDSEKLKVYLYSLLFYIFVPESSYHYELQEGNWSFVNEKGGAFSLSAALVNQAIGSRLIDRFKEILLKKIAEEKFTNESEIFTILEQNANDIQYFPIENLEYIIGIGEWLRDCRSEVEMLPEIEEKTKNKGIEKVLRNYFKKMETCFCELDREYGTEYGAVIPESPLYQMMKNKEFVEHLAYTISEKTDWYRGGKGETDWGEK